MTALLEYKQIVEEAFGQNSFSIDKYSPMHSEIISSFTAATGYSCFRQNFSSRLERLGKAFDEHKSRTALITQVNEVANPSNWEGAFSELVALDFFNSQSDFLTGSLELDKSISPNRALAEKLGKQEANLDVYFQDFDVYTDVKALKDNISEIFEGIYKQIWPTHRPLIQAEYRLDTSYDIIQRKRKEILQTLNEAMNIAIPPTVVDCSKTIKDLKFRIQWDAGSLITEAEYSPYRHSQECHKLAFLHAKKFVTDRPFFLTFVAFPWFNNIITDFGGANEIFYRSFARRVFCQYRYDTSKFSDWYSKYTGDESIWDVSRHLGGILFLEDNSLKGKNPNETNIKGFYYENPNGYQVPSRGTMSDYFRELVNVYDDFRYDNY